MNNHVNEFFARTLLSNRPEIKARIIELLNAGETPIQIQFMMKMHGAGKNDPFVNPNVIAEAAEILSRTI